MPRIWDRILGRWVTEVVTPVQPGRYRAESTPGELRVIPIFDGAAECPGRTVEAVHPTDPAELLLDARAIEMLANEQLDQREHELVLALGLEPAEQDDAAMIGFLDARDAFRKVMNDPAELLERQDELVGLGRGGRITPRTMRRLASHADDWRSRRNHSVEPHRLLVERLYPNVDRPENRLVINTLVLLKQQLEVLADDAAGQSRLNDAERLQEMHFRASRRTTRLWSRTISDRSDRQLTEALNRRKDDLTDARTAIDNLSSTPLGQALAPWRRRRAEGAFGSNLLRDHEAYSKIGRLWHQLDADGELDDSARRAIAVGREERFDNYVLACVQIAVQHWSALQSSGDKLILDADVRREHDGSITVSVATFAGEHRAVRVVPQFIGLDVALGDAKARPDDASPVIIVRSAGRGEYRLLRLGASVNGTLVGVGPYALASVEAMGSALRWHLEAPEFLHYPRRLRLPQNFVAAAKSFAVTGLTTRPEAGHQTAIVSVARDVDLAEMALQIVSPKERTEQLTAAVGQFRLDTRWTWLLRRCPACGQVARSFDSEGDRFHARCVASACDATWGVDRCENQHRRPFLRFPSDGKDRGLERWAAADDDPCPECLDHGRARSS